MAGRSAQCLLVHPLLTSRRGQREQTQDCEGLSIIKVAVQLSASVSIGVDLFESRLQLDRFVYSCYLLVQINNAIVLMPTPPAA